MATSGYAQLGALKRKQIGDKKTNEHITDNAKKTVTGFDNIAFSVDSKLTTLTITITSGKTNKTATLSLK
jgi:hypothetical protein